MPVTSPRVGLFVTCLVDMFRPSVGFAAVKLLEDAGCTVEVPEAQTCCGQPAYNSGDTADARAIALNVIAAFKGFDYVVAPSGSCGGMMVKHYPELFEVGSTEQDDALDLARRTHELTSFLTRVMKLEKVAAEFPARATYHDSCSGLRELGIRNEPRKLLASVAGVSLREMTDAEVCCGFGGTFAAKFPMISTAMGDVKCASAAETGAEYIVSNDSSCLMHLQGLLSRQGKPMKTIHLAEVLAQK